jgi:hypothetical protein
MRTVSPPIARQVLTNLKATPDRLSAYYTIRIKIFGEADYQPH